MSAKLLLCLAAVFGIYSSHGQLDEDDDFLLAANVGPDADGLLHLQPLLAATYRGATFFAHISQAELHAQHGRISDAAASYAYVLSNYQLDDVAAAPVHLALGNALSAMSRTGEAEQEYRYAAQARKFAHLAYYCMGLLYARSARTSDAVQALETALFFRPAFFAAVHALGSLHIIRGNVEKGLRMYDSALHLLLDGGILPVEASENETVAPQAPGENLGEGLVRHVLHVFEVPTETVASLIGAKDGAEKRIVALGRSLRRFLNGVNSLDLAAFHRSVGMKLADTGALQDGLAHLRRAVSLSPSNYGYLLLWTTLAQPLAYANTEDVWSTRATTVKNVRQALEDRVTVVSPELLYELYQLQYQLPFSGLPAHLLMRDIARLFAASEVPVLPYLAPRLYSEYGRLIGSINSIAIGSAVAGAAPGTEAVAVGTDGGTAAVVPKRRLNPFKQHGIIDEAAASVWAASRGGADAAGGEATATAAPAHEPAIIRVGLITYQTHDSAVGRLFHRLALHLRGYTAAVANLRKTNKSFDLFGNYSTSAPSGPGQDPLVTCQGRNGSNTGCDDPLVQHGYVTLPGVAGFHVTLLRMTPKGDAHTRVLIDAADEVPYAGSRPFKLETARKVMSDARLDVLIASDPGIQPEMYSLLFGRVAPVQVALWGTGAMAHTLTLGLDKTVDYYVVGNNGAADNIQEQILEEVVRIGDVGVHFQRLAPVTAAERFAASRRHGLLEGRHLYLVPTTLNALHPAFDDVLLGVLAADPAGEALCLYEQGQELWLAATRERHASHPLAQVHGHSLTLRVRFDRDFMYAAYREKLALMSAAEVVLDTFPVGLGLTAMEALAVGTPVVTLPSRQPLRPFAAGLLARMNLTEQLVATDVQDYVSKAVKLAGDSEYRRGVRARLLGRKGLLEWRDTGSANVTLVEPQPGVDGAIEAENNAWLAHQQELGYGNQAGATLNDWLRFLGSKGRSWAVDRAWSERVAASQAAADKKKKARAKSKAAGRSKGNDKPAGHRTVIEPVPA